MFGFFLTAHAQITFTFDSKSITCHNADGHAIQVYLGNFENGIPEDQPSIAGKTENNTFFPFIPFGLQQTYTVKCREQLMVFELPLPEDYLLPTIDAIYPTDSLVPSNLLKFYITFNKPMALKAYPFIDLLNREGEKIERGILKEIPELWNEDRTELCVWIEPGRIKQGLGPNERLGPVMLPNNEYTIRVSRDLRDANGIKLQTPISKKIQTIADDRVKPNYTLWKVTPPKAGSIKTLQLNFDERMDFGSVLSLIQIEDAQGKILNGNWEIGENEKTISYIPEKKWQMGSYQLKISGRVEDLAGNNLNRLFDQDISQLPDLEKEYYTVGFSVE